MSIILSILAAAVVSYLLGSCNSSIIVVRLLKNEDIREHGSCNAGLTNTLRCYGKKCALITLIGDLLKGVVAVFISRLICSLLEGGLSPDNDTHYIAYIAGFFAIIGHVFPLYYGFKGGKGVLVGVSTFIAVDPLLFFILILVFAIVLSISKYVSLASITASSLCPVATFLLHYFVYGDSLSYSFLYTALALIMASVVVYMHKTNIIRLKNGNENKFSFKSKHSKR